MISVRKSLALFLIAALCSFAVAAGAQKTPAPAVTGRELQRRSFALNFLRALNNAEQDYKKKHGTFGNWDALFAEGYFTDTGTKWGSADFPTVTQAMYSRATEIVPGWKLRLTISNGGKSYDALAEDATDAKCGYAGVTDERGMIRESEFISCKM
jgi:hypothetical protein